MAANLTLTPELADALAAAVERGVPITTAAQAAGISKTQASAWLLSAERGMWPDGTPLTDESRLAITAFAEKIARARANHEARMVASITEAATVPNAKTGLPDWRAGAWYLNNAPHTRETYRQERQVQMTGSVQHDHAHRLVQGKSVDELDTLEQELLALGDGSAEGT